MSKKKKLSGDLLQVVADRKHLGFMRYYPNFIQLGGVGVSSIAQRVNSFAYFAFFFFFSSRSRHTRSLCDWSSDVCSSDLSRWSMPPSRAARTTPDSNAEAGR